jgi:hypothetical protein
MYWRIGAALVGIALMAIDCVWLVSPWLFYVGFGLVTPTLWAAKR